MNEMETFSVRDRAGNGESVQTRQDERSGQTLRDEGRSEKRALCLIFRPKVSSGSLELNRRAARVPLWCDTRANM